MIFKGETKSVPITKEMVWASYKKVKSHGGSAAIDQQSLLDFEKVRSKELYKLWNRLASGSYFSPMIKRVSIQKGRGKTRPLGIPTASDRIAQQVIKTYLEPRLEAIFVENSYGYRPKKSAHTAIQKVQENVRRYHWVIDLDIAEFFENLSHELLMKALKRHVGEQWVLMYINRWLEAPVYLENGTIQLSKGKGTPQGGVISPLLANLYLHYSIDKWMEINYPNSIMVRYADDLIIHCRSHEESTEILESLKARLKACGLQAHSEKTKIVYCKKHGRNLQGYSVQFDFLGFSFQPIRHQLRRGGGFLQYDCKMSRKSKLRIIQGLRKLGFHNKTQRGIQGLAILLNPKIRGWIQYYGKISRSVAFPENVHIQYEKSLLENEKKSVQSDLRYTIVICILILTLVALIIYYVLLPLYKKRYSQRDQKSAQNIKTS